MTKESTSSKLTELFELFKSGALTKEEYEKLKQQILSEDGIENAEPEKKQKHEDVKPTEKPNQEEKRSRNWIFSTIGIAFLIVVFVVFRTYLFSGKKELDSNETESEIDSQEVDNVEDIDGNIYHTVKIGSQVWMDSNLKTTHYNDGTPIQLVPNNDLWRSLETPAYCWFDNKEGFKNTYGALYNWHTINTNKLCPEGWHVPSDSDWKTLTDYLTINGYGYHGSGEDIGKSLASTTGWVASTEIGAVGNDQSINNKSGFKAYPSGIRFSNGEFRHKGENAKWWSSTETSATSAQIRFISWSDGIVASYSNRKENGFSVRCVRDIGATENTLPVNNTSINKKKIDVWNESIAKKIIIDELKKSDGWEYDKQTVMQMGFDEVTFQKIDLGKSHKMIGFASSNFIEVDECPPLCNSVLSVFEFENRGGWILTQKAKGISSSRSARTEFQWVQVSPDNYGILTTENLGSSMGGRSTDITLYTFINNKLKPILSLSHSLEKTGFPYSADLKTKERDDYFHILVEEKEEPKNADPIITRTYYKFNGSNYEEFSGVVTDESLTDISRFYNNSKSEQSNKNGKYIREYLTSHTFVNYEVGGTTYLTFTSRSGGWYGAMKMKMGACDYLYTYDLDDRDIKLTFSGSTCGGQGSSQTLTFNNDNSISVYIKGQKFVFKPM